MKVIVLTIFILFQGLAIAETLEECNEALKTLMENEINHPQLKKLLKLQGKLTLHRLAWASSQGKEDTVSFELENRIDEILTSIDTNQDPEFIKARELYRKNKLSRTALARILPYVRDILNEQNKITDTKKRKKYIIQMSDIKLLSILAEKEGVRSDGLLDHRLFKHTNKDQSILNFTKVINSSMKNRKIKDSISSFEQQIESLTSELAIAVEKLPLSRPCKDMILNQCGENNQKAILENTILNFIEDMQDFNKTEVLKYDDFWLHVGKKYIPNDSRMPSEDPPVINQEDQREPIILPAIATEEISIIGSDGQEKIIQIELLPYQDEYFDKLAQSVLDRYPYFLSKEDLIGNKELLLAIAQALDSRERNFQYQDKIYYLPESYNLSDLKANGEKIYKSIMNSSSITAMDRRLNLQHVAMFENLKRKYNDYRKLIPDFGAGIDNGPNKEEVLKDLNDEFLYSLIAANDGEIKQKSFEFRGALYDTSTGQAIDRSIVGLTSYPTTESVEQKAPIERYTELSTEQRNNAIASAIENNKTYVYENKLHTNSHSQVDTNNVLENRTRLSDDEITSRISALITTNASTDQEERQIVAQALIEGKKAIILDTEVINPLTLRSIPLTDQTSAIENFQEANNLTPPSSVPQSRQYTNSWYSAMTNGERNFQDNDQRYSTLTGLPITERLERTPSDMIDYGEYKNVEEQLNALDDKNLIIEFHKNFKTKEDCDYYTIIDKKKHMLFVYNKSGVVLFEREILLGANSGDKRTIFLEELYNDGRRATNGKTSAGIFYSYKFRDSTNDDYYEYYNNNLLALVTEKGAFNGPLNADNQYETVMAMHQTPVGLEHRNTMYNNGNDEDNKTTNGCLNLTQEDFESYKNEFPDQGCPVYILPEEENADGTRVSRMKVVDGQLIFTPTSRSRCSTGEICNRDYYYSPLENEKIKDIDLVVMNPVHAGNPIALEYIQTLEDSKRELIEKLGLTNNEYNDLAQMAYAVFGVESGFGTEERYQLKEGGKITSISRSLASIPTVGPGGALTGLSSWLLDKYAQFISQTAVSTKKVIDGNDSDNSRGLTQIKNVTSFTEKYYPEINENNLTEPRNAALATMIVLKEMSSELKRMEGRHNNINEDNRSQFLYYIYNGSTSQIRNGAGTPNISIRAREIQTYLDQIKLYEELDD